MNALHHLSQHQTRSREDASTPSILLRSCLGRVYCCLLIPFLRPPQGQTSRAVVAQTRTANAPLNTKPTSSKTPCSKNEKRCERFHRSNGVRTLVARVRQPGPAAPMQANAPRNQWRHGDRNMSLTPPLPETGSIIPRVATSRLRVSTSITSRSLRRWASQA